MPEGEQDVRYMEIVHGLQQSDSTSTGMGHGTHIGTSVGTHISTCIGTGIGVSTSTGRRIGTGAGACGMDYCLIVDGLVRFRDRIYMSNSSKLKKVIFREFHAKPCSGHPIYEKTLTKVKRFYYCLNLKRDVAKLVARCFNYQ